MCALSSALLTWTRYVGIAMLLPLVLFAGWDLRRYKPGRLPRAGVLGAGVLLHVLVLIWSPEQFRGGLDALRLPDMAFDILRGPVRKLFSATLDAAGPALFLTFALSALAGAGWFLWSRVPDRYRPTGWPARPRFPDGNPRFVVLCYTLVGLASYNAVTVAQLIGATEVSDPIDPFVELRFAAPNLPWILAGLGSLWGLASHAGVSRRLPTQGALRIASVLILVTTVATEREALSGVLAPRDTVLPYQHGYAREHRDQTDRVAAFLQDAAQGHTPLPVALLAPSGQGLPPRDYFRSVFFLPHRANVRPDAPRFRIGRPEEVERYRYRIAVDGNATRAEPAVIHYVESTSDFSPEAIVAHLGAQRTGPLSRFILLTADRPQLPSELEVFIRLGYRPGATVQSGVMRWIIIERN